MMYQKIKKMIATLVHQAMSVKFTNKLSNGYISILVEYMGLP